MSKNEIIKQTALAIALSTTDQLATNGKPEEMQAIAEVWARRAANLARFLHGVLDVEFKDAPKSPAKKPSK